MEVVFVRAAGKGNRSSCGASVVRLTVSVLHGEKCVLEVTAEGGQGWFGTQSLCILRIGRVEMIMLDLSCLGDGVGSGADACLWLVCRKRAVVGCCV